MSVFDPSCIDVFDYLECLEIRNVEKATDKEVRFSCPYPAHVKGDETPSAYMNLETTAFFCHSCKARGDAISFASDFLGVSPIAAIRMLKQRYSPGGIDPDSRCMVEEIRKIIHKSPPARKVNRILPESALEAYFVDWSVVQYWRHADWARYVFIDRGFSVQTLTEWQFGYSGAYKRITLPVRDEQGRLIGFKARAWEKDRKPKYLNFNDRDNGVEAYLKSDVVFGLDRAIRYFEERQKIGGGIYFRPTERTLIVVEGEFNSIAMHQLGYRNTVAINGSYISAHQIRLLKRYAEKVVLFFDSDQAGAEATTATAEALRPHLFVDVVPDHEGDPADMHPYSVRRCLSKARGYTEALLTRS